jgi:hypothetical protein
MTYTMQGLGAVSAADAASKIAAFAKAAKDEAERCFAATTLHMDVDRQRADDVITTAAQAATAAKSASTPAKAKNAINDALVKITAILPQIKSSADVAKVQAAATAAKSAIDAAAQAASLKPQPEVLPPSESGGGFSLSSIPPVALVAVAAAAALFLLPGKKRSNPSSMVKTRSDEKLWRRAKAAARRQGRSDYRYIVGTFKHMQANKALSRL